ncbi:hypothetical protein [Roseivirga spongicola]|nr:hypothetical protein [Roseivirga spongicola]WPZ11934.1 hypothetical protein T7867_07410 [Roseivirga spongicola]
MDREKIIDFLNANYVSVFINHPILGKIDLWPLIRVQLYSQLIKNLENLSTSKDERKSTIFEKIVSIPSRLRSIAECFFIKKNERLLLGANSHRVDHEGSSFNRFFDPELTKNGLLLEYAGKRDVNYYSKTIELFEVLPIWSFFSGYNKYSIKEAELFKLRCLLDVVSKRFGCPFLNFESTILTSLRTIGKWENLFTFLLKKSRAQEVVALCYYSNPVFGAFLAASRIGVKKVDLQHGPQTSTHGAYGKWKYIFKNHNYLMPNEFWTWDESSAKTINDFTLNPEYHRSVVYGNDWIKYWKNKNSKMAIPNSLYLLSLQPLETPIPSDFLNFMAKTAGDGVFWWIRFHPRQTLLDYAFVKELLINHITNDESFFLDKGNEFPLPEILKNTSVHFTCFSGTALEAAEFNIPTYFLDSRACDLIVQRPKLFFWFRDFKIGWEKFEVE